MTFHQKPLRLWLSRGESFSFSTCISLFENYDWILKCVLALGAQCFIPSISAEMFCIVETSAMKSNNLSSAEIMLPPFEDIISMSTLSAHQLDFCFVPEVGMNTLQKSRIQNMHNICCSTPLYPFIHTKTTADSALLRLDGKADSA
jgi:hypothetical protein